MTALRYLRAHISVARGNQREASEVRPANKCSTRHRVASNLKNEGLQCVEG